MTGTAAAADTNTRPIFILGTQRSGTTLLRLILDSHPNIAVGFETGFMRAVKTIKHVPDYAYGKEWYRRWGIDERDMNERIRQFYGGIFEHYARSQGKPRWGEKTPLNLFQMDEMASIFPDAQFVCIVRHPGAVAASMMRWRYSFEDAVDYWRKANKRILTTSQQLDDDRTAIFRFEDLLLEPQNVLSRLMVFLGEPWSDNLLRHHDVHRDRGTATKVEGGTQSDRPLDPSRIDDWRERLDDEQLDFLARRARGLLRHFGYDATTAVPVRPIAPVWEDKKPASGGS